MVWSVDRDATRSYRSGDIPLCAAEWAIIGEHTKPTNTTHSRSDWMINHGYILLTDTGSLPYFPELMENSARPEGGSKITGPPGYLILAESCKYTLYLCLKKLSVFVL